MTESTVMFSVMMRSRGTSDSLRRRASVAFVRVMSKTPPHREAHRGYLAKLQRVGEPVKSSSVRLNTHDGSTRKVAFTAGSRKSTP